MGFDGLKCYQLVGLNQDRLLVGTCPVPVFVCCVVLFWFYLLMVNVVADDLWMTYDDLKSTAVCQYKSPFPTIDPAEIHIVMWRSRPVRSSMSSGGVPAVGSAARSVPVTCNISVPLTATVAPSVLPIPSVLPLPATVIPVVPAAANHQLLRACGMFANQWTQPSAVNGSNRFTWCSVLQLPPVIAGTVQPKVLSILCYSFFIHHHQNF